MDIETCSKYLQFLTNECDKYLKDLDISDDELLSMGTEIQRFKKQCNESNLPLNLLEKINKIDFKYNRSDLQKTKYIMLIAILTLGIFGYMLHMKQRIKRENALINLKSQISGLPVFIKMNC